ncbi:MAG: N-acyl homoserine lactonase family protein [Acetobacteraceae bacterium]|nr:N-acyl homoserine lactonase family protein [Acetobacteraceae bacterium]
MTALTPGGLRVHAIQTGWVRVKRRHRSYAGPDALRLPAILLDRAWTEWLPILCYAIEHPEGLFLLDTGETAAAMDPAHFACTRGDAVFYGRNLRFQVRPEEEAAAQLRALGLDPGAVRTVVMTHLHSDHAGGMGGFPRAEFLVSRADAGGHLGTLTCRLPAASRLRPVEHDGPPDGAFAASHPITRDRRLRLVPTPGHSPAHQSLLIVEGDRRWLLAGDAAFDQGQVARGEMAGIVADPGSARGTLEVLRREIEEQGTVLLPAHDAEAPSRLRRAMA